MGAPLARRVGDPAANLLGAMLLAVGIGAPDRRRGEGPDWGWSDVRTLSAWVISAASLLAFAASSARHPFPGDRPGVAAGACVRLVERDGGAVAVPFAGALLDDDPVVQQVWGLLRRPHRVRDRARPLMVPVFAALAHRLAQRIPIGVLVSVGCLLCGVGSTLSAGLVGAVPHYAGEVLPGWLIAGAGVGLALPAILSSATADLPRAQAATGSAVVNKSRQVGTALGVSVVVAVLGAPVGFAAAPGPSSTPGGPTRWSRFSRPARRWA